MSRDVPAEPQNIYDDPTFFAGYRALRQNDSGLNGALETPALRALLPALAGLRVLDLGCGFGDFVRFARGQGAVAVTGLDISERMLEEAARLTDDPAVGYVRGAIEDFGPISGAFDLAVSSLALHYVADYRSAVSRIFDALAPAGRFVFSVEHPMCTADPSGWTCDAAGRPLHWPVDRYREEGRRDTRWFVDGVVKYHRTVETYVTGLIAAGFRIEALGEPAPTAAALAARPELALHARRPPFLLLSALRPA
ncbi:class I SAM-dependent methyltransferase [Phreatobacter sp. AB_2022a]|uniref:class I SAM-dependent methyltransferase n=1 Tax=Phreatobacter sp. AB_2022a TaxID=3003134 RepID=UPI002286EBD4|nr:class I SAM-dependent methyltransferase [Phreatobacter sp. AB_2022a]MCZ0735844.1 class I SAM-dependent methyltransferase [Phreatobacter sp. AB_2022a]